MLTDFLKHLFPRLVLKKNLRLSYTFCLGGMACTCLLILLLSGFLLLFHYQPNPQQAFESILALETRIPGGRYLRSLHRLASHAYLLLLFLHSLRVILTGAYRPPRQMNWWIGFALLLLSLFTAYTGYLLPMDQLALWATQTGMNLAAELPFGSFVKGLLVPDAVGESYSLLRFYIMHILVVPVGIISLVALHFYRIRKDKGILPYL